MNCLGLYKCTKETSLIQDDSKLVVFTCTYVGSEDTEMLETFVPELLINS